MRRHNNFLTLGLCLLTAPFIAQAQTSTTATCNTATLTGPHAITITGRDVTSAVVVSKVYLANGIATFDGVGGVTFNLTVNTNAAASVSQAWSGSYSIPTSCIGQITIANGDPGASFSLIPFNSGKNFTMIGSDSTYSLTGTGSSTPAGCLTSSLSGPYAFTGTGYTLAAGVITGVDTISGILNFDGTGNITSGNWQVSSGTTTTTDTIQPAKYTLSSSCVGSATVTDANGVAVALSFDISTVPSSDFTLVLSSPTSIYSTAGHSTITYPGLAVELANLTGFATAPGSLFSVFGTGMSTGTGSAPSFPLQTNMFGATVTVNGEAAPLYYVSSTLINAQMPWDIPTGQPATVIVKNGSAVSNSVTIVVPPAAPGIFTYGTNQASAQNFPSYTLNTSTNPAKAGSVVIVYFTGGGPVQGGSTLVAGQATPAQSYQVTDSVSATIGGQPAQVGYVGLVPTSVGGFYQANITVPAVGTGNKNVVITINGVPSNIAHIYTD